MGQHPPAERTLYADLSQLLMASRNLPQGEVDAHIEEIVRDFMRSNPELGVGGLQITFTWRMPEGADEWAVYATEYRTLPAEQPEPLRAIAGGPAKVLAFPAPSSSDRGGTQSGSAQVIPFPRRGLNERSTGRAWHVP